MRDGERRPHQPVTLLWALERAAAGAPRLAPWTDVQPGLVRAMAGAGVPTGSRTPEYPVLALRRSRLWEIAADQEPPTAHSSTARRWLDLVNPLLGLSVAAHKLAADPAARAVLIEDVRELLRPEPTAGPTVGSGDAPPAAVGSVFASRRALADAKVHRALQAGIVGTAARGAESIVVSGGYEDDEDLGNEIIYTGHGSRGPDGRQNADQSFDSPGNAALVTSCLAGQPVRVIRGAHRGSPHAPESGYRYDGSFRVESYWREQGRSGFLVCRYHLVAAEPDALQGLIEPTAPADAGPGTLPSGQTQPERRTTTTQRVVRSSRVVEWVKKVHDHRCQICSTRLTIGNRGYSEGAHIRPLGRPHAGPDVADNVLCLCPNCHVLFDNGAIVITDGMTAQHRDGSGSGHSVRTDDRHQIDVAQLRYHRDIHR